MRRLALAALIAGSPACARASFDAAGAAGRMGALLEGSGAPGACGRMGAALRQGGVAGAPAELSIFPAGLWEGLSAPSSPTLAALAAREPGLDPAQVREIGYQAADPVMAAAAARRLTGLDLFSDPALRTPRIFYFSARTLARLFQKYDLRSLNVPAGVDVHGRPFRMDGLLAGDGRVVIFYDRNDFHFANPYYNDFHYEAESRVVYTILGDADLAVSGLKVDAAVIHPRITRVVKTSARRMLVETTWGAREKPLWPITLRADDAPASGR